MTNSQAFTPVIPPVFHAFLSAAGCKNINVICTTDALHLTSKRACVWHPNRCRTGTFGAQGAPLASITLNYMICTKGFLQGSVFTTWFQIKIAGGHSTTDRHCPTQTPSAAGDIGPDQKPLPFQFLVAVAGIQHGRRLSQEPPRFFTSSCHQWPRLRCRRPLRLSQCVRARA